jgi:hypothetical protein
MKVYWGSGGIVPRPGRFIPKETAAGIHWIGGWVGPSAGLGEMVKRKFPALTGTRTADHPARSAALLLVMMCGNMKRGCFCVSRK